MSFKCLGVLDATGGSGRACACTAVGRGGEQWSDLLGVKDALPKQWHKTEIFYVIKRSVKIFSVHYETVAGPPHYNWWETINGKHCPVSPRGG